MEKRINWHVEKRKVKDLKPYTKNPRVITEIGLDNLKKSFDEIGFAQPININLDNTILSGHARVQQLLKENIEEVDCYVPDRKLTPKQEEAVIIRMNKNVAGEWNFKMLMDDFDFSDLEDWGFKEEDFENLELPEVEKIFDEENEDEAPEVKGDPITEKGDVWVLGNHRLLCGDSTLIDDVEKLMNGQKADMVFTDPPYGINYQSNWGSDFDILKNDNKFLDFIPCLEMATKNNSAWFIWTSHHVYSQWRLMYKNYYKSTVIWKKNNGSMGDLTTDYSMNYEMALFCVKGRPKFINKRPMAVWEISRDHTGNYIHPTQKPVALSEYAMSHFLKSNTLVLDLFLGSGSTLIASEKTNRKCYGMELDPKYCDVIIKRWQDLTGKKAILEKTKQAFDELIENKN